MGYSKRIEMARCVVHTFRIPALEKQRQADLFVSEASLVYKSVPDS